MLRSSFARGDGRRSRYAVQFDDIAEVLGISETNVATKIGRLKERFRREAAAAQIEGEANGAR